MPKAICRLKSADASPISFSRHHDAPKLARELDKDYEERTWREQAHCDENGMAYIPANMISNAFKAAALYLAMKVPSTRGATYTKNIDAGTIVLEGISLGVTKEQLQSETVFVPSDGKRGGSKRVNKIFPIVPSWEGVVTFHILDPIITKDVFVRHLKVTGSFIGLGRWRPRNGGLYGRFVVISVEWVPDQEAGEEEEERPAKTKANKGKA